MHSITSLKNRERILEAIDQLRNRKARPDIHRICNYLFKRFGINSTVAKNDLQWCVNNNIVLQVEYKGNVSYRNAAKKWAQMKQRERDQNSLNGNDRKFVELLTSAMGELIVTEPDYLEFGVPADLITANVLAKDNIRYTKKYVGMLLDKHARSGALVRTESGGYLLGRSSAEAAAHDRSPSPLAINSVERQYKSKQSSIAPSDLPVKQIEMITDDTKSDSSIRVGGRCKKVKKVFDPSDVHVPKKRGRPGRRSDERPESRNGVSGVCSVCHNTQSKKGSNKLIACRECSNKAHIQCLNGENMLLRLSPDNTWQCPYCKTCSICYETSDAGNLMVCSVCADGYHMNCHRPRITEQSKNWVCTNCTAPTDIKLGQFQGINSLDDNATSPDISSRSITPSSSPPRLTPQSSPKPETPQPFSRPATPTPEATPIKTEPENDDFIDPTIPDASHWTYEDVYQYFVKYFPEEAKIFREQEIDGRSLLLLTRIDVLSNLNLKLGPALKIYKHVVKLQFRRDDPRLYWL